MPRGSARQVTPAQQQQRKLLFEMTGDHDGSELLHWDIQTEPFVEALLGIVSTGAVVMLRPGSGGRALGIAIWEGDVRHPAKWFYETAEVDDWSLLIRKRVAGDISQAAD